MVQLHLTQRVVKNTTKKERKELEKYTNNLQNQNISSDNFYYLSLEDGERKIYGRQTATAQEQYNFIVIHKNKQYQWLLAEAYEEFEDFIENIYAYIGFKDNNLWRCSDFGNTTLSTLKDKDYEWFQERSRKQKTKDILKRLGDNFSEIENINKNNVSGVNLKLAITLIENLRHIIVHKNGVIDKKEKFIQHILEKAGLCNNGKPKLEYTEFITQYFGGGENKNRIRLLDIPQSNYGIITNVLETLTNYLVAYSFFIIKIIRKNFDK